MLQRIRWEACSAVKPFTFFPRASICHGQSSGGADMCSSSQGRVCPCGHACAPSPRLLQLPRQMVDARAPYETIVRCQCPGLLPYPSLCLCPSAILPSPDHRSHPHLALTQLLESSRCEHAAPPRTPALKPLAIPVFLTPTPPSHRWP